MAIGTERTHTPPDLKKPNGTTASDSPSRQKQANSNENSIQDKQERARHDTPHRETVLLSFPPYPV